MSNFVSVEFELIHGDIIYLFSYGFAEKFKYKPFKNMLLQNANLPMKEQKAIIEKNF